MRVLSDREVYRIHESYGFKETRWRGSHVVMQRGRAADDHDSGAGPPRVARRHACMHDQEAPKRVHGGDLARPEPGAVARLPNTYPAALIAV